MRFLAAKPKEGEDFRILGDIGGLASRGRPFSFLLAHQSQDAEPLNLLLLGTSL